MTSIKKVGGFVSSHRVVVLIVALCVAIAALYGQFLWNPIVFDDLPFFMLDNNGNLPISDYRYDFLELRSLPYATLAWGTTLLGVELLHFRVENLLLHTAVVIFLFVFSLSLFEAVYGARIAAFPNSRLLAFSAALLFALHPVASYAVGYLVQRTILMATLFGLLAMLTYLHGSVRQKSIWLWASVLFYYLAVYSKEHAIMLPAVIVALCILLHDDWLSKLRKQWTVFTAFAMIGMLVLFAKKGILGSVYEVNATEMLPGAGSDDAYLLSVLTQSWLFFKYIALWLAPNPEWMSVDMREPFASSLWSPYLLASGAFLVWGVISIFLLFKRGRLGLLGFAMLFPWLMFMTELSTVRIQEGFVLYRSYLWAAGTFVLIPLLLSLISRRMVVMLTAVIAAAFFAVSMERLSTMSHPLLLWDDAAKLVKDRDDLPGTYRIYYNRGTELLKVDQYDKAIADFKRVLELESDYSPAFGNMGAAYLKKHEWESAVDAFSRVIEIAHRTGEGLDMRPFYGRAMAYEALGRADKARLDYRESCRLGKKGCEKL